ncbi:MAG TPA: NusG domain II-containing protein [Gammaproteobacteria bacterium]|nr:NusG domain II-containing protein [Gammaproteobacteria bacterium]
MNKDNDPHRSSSPLCKRGAGGGFCKKAAQGFATRADLVILALTLALLPYLYISYWGDAVQGEQARILVAGKEFAVVSLHDEQRLSVPGALGSSVLEIRAGKVRFADSPCHGKQCVHSGWLALGGEFAACLPNRISVQVVGREPRFDTINF